MDTMTLTTLTTDEIVHGFADRTLPAHHFTHDAHLTVCHHSICRVGRDATFDHFRWAIRAFNTAKGTANTDTSGYHETLTRYYIGTVAHLIALGRDDLPSILVDPACARDAPLKHWSRRLLMSVEARRSWTDPDLLPLPW